jgi:hypothetical protein
LSDKAQRWRLLTLTKTSTKTSYSQAFQSQQSGSGSAISGALDKGQIRISWLIIKLETQLEMGKQILGRETSESPCYSLIRLVTTRKAKATGCIPTFPLERANYQTRQSPFGNFVSIILIKENMS